MPGGSVYTMQKQSSPCILAPENSLVGSLSLSIGRRLGWPDFDYEFVVVRYYPTNSKLNRNFRQNYLLRLCDAHYGLY